MKRTKKVRLCLHRTVIICFAVFTLQELAVYGNHVVEFALEPSDTVVQSGNSAVLDCVIRSANYSLDTMNVQWLDGDGQPISFIGDNYRSQLLNNSLYVSSVLADLGLTGQYQCKVSLPNAAGSIVSRTAVLSLASLAESFDEEPSPNMLLLFTGQKAHFPCRISGNPSPVRVRWLKDDRPLVVDELRMTILPSGALQIDEITETDQGTYRCNATTINLHRLSGKATLALNGDLAEAALPTAPTFIVKPMREVTVTEGQTVTLDCAANGNPRPKMKWLKDGANIDMADLDSRFSKVGTTSSLKISGIKEEDGGSYQCLAENREDSVDASATVQVHVPPRLRRRPTDKVEYVSEDVELECNVYGRPEPQVHWLKNGELIHPTGYHQINVNGNNLRIMGLLLSDTGLFQCVAANVAGNVQGSASLKVISQDTIKKARKRKLNPKASLSDKNNSDQVYGSLKQSPHSKPPNPFHILTSLSSSSSSASDNNNNNNLGSTLNVYSHIPTISQQQYDDDDDDSSGNVGGAMWPSNGSDVDGDAAEQQRPGPPLDVAAIVTKARFIVLTWKAPAVNDGDDIITYSVFYRQDGNQRERVQNTTGTIVGGGSRRTATGVEEAHLSNLQPSTVYMIRVVAWNHVGMGRSTVPIAVTTAFEENNMAGAARHLHAHPTSSQSIHVQWLAPLDVTATLTPITYRVNYVESAVKQLYTIDTTEMHVNLIGLSVYTEYSVWVESVNANGVGAATPDLIVRTFGSAPTQPPRNITVEATSSTSILIGWEEPAADAQNGIITGYKIRYRQRGLKADTVTTAANERSHALHHLDNRATGYQVRLWAMNVNGTGPPTDWLDVDTYATDLDESRVPDEPAELRTKATANTITVYWTPPRSGGGGVVRVRVRVRNYIISWGKGVPDMFSREVSERDREYTIPLLESDAEYVVSLRASNEMGAGVPKYANIRTTLHQDSETLDHMQMELEQQQRRPPLLPPIGVKAQVLGETSAVLYWTDTDTTINHHRATAATSTTTTTSDLNRYYVVHYQAEGLKAKEVNATTNNILVSDLRPGTMYEFMVKVIKGRRESPWSMVVVNSTTVAQQHHHLNAAAAAPRELQVKLLQDDAQMVRLSWLPPKPSGTNINGYVILYTTDQSKRDRDWNATAVKGDRLMYEMTNLEPSARYYFKIQARINKGNGPFSAVATIETGPNIGIPPPPVNKDGVFSGTMLLYLIAGALVLALTTIFLVVFCLCCRRGGGGGDRRDGAAHMTIGGTSLGMLGTSPDRSKKGYQGVSGGGGGGGVKPPDLWIHHDQMELKQMDCGKGGGGDCASSSGGAVTLPRTTPDDYVLDPHPHHIQYQPQHIHHYQPHHLNSLDKRQGYVPTFNMGAATTPPPSQLNASISSAAATALDAMQCVTSTTPAVQYGRTGAGAGAGAGVVGLPQHHHIYHDNNMTTYSSAAAQPLLHCTGNTASAAATYDPYSYNSSGYGGVSSSTCLLNTPPATIVPPPPTMTIAGVQHPLKSFTVPAPPPPISAPATPKHLVRGNNYANINHSSPYKKPASVMAVPSPIVQMVCAGAGGGNTVSASCTTPPLQQQQLQQQQHPDSTPTTVRPSHSTEELNQEMEHLEGLMITLNKITSNEFQC